MSKSIIFPGGAGGNHVRWLLYFDDSFVQQGRTTLEDKMFFIKNRIYSPESRRYHNWLNVEWQWRQFYDSIIEIKHTIKSDPPEDQTLFLNFTDWTHPFEHYYCLNPGLNSSRPEDYKRFINIYVSELSMVPNLPNKKILICDKLFDRVLDKEFYDTIVDFFQMSNHYDLACEVHELWNNARKQAYKEFYEYYSGPEWNDFLNRMRLKGSAND